MEQYENEADLIDYLKILWKRRWLIIVPTILLALAAGVAGFLTPPEWEVDAVIQPSKFFVLSEQGAVTEAAVVDPKQLAGRINQGSYDRLISAELNLDPRTFPKLKAEILRDTDLLRVSTRTRETDKARAILNALYQRLKGDLDRKIEAGMKGISAQIALKENDIKTKGLDIQSLTIDIEKAQQEIVTAGNKLKISEARSRRIAEEITAVQARIDDIKKQRQTMLAEKQGGVETLGLLLYSNEIQQSYNYYNTLEDSFSKEKNTQEDLRLSVRGKTQVIKGFKTQIDKIGQAILALQSNVELLNGKKQLSDYAQLVKEPTVSLYPVSPRKMRNVLIAGFLGFFCFSILALGLEYGKKVLMRLRAGS